MSESILDRADRDFELIRRSSGKEAALAAFVEELIAYARQLEKSEAAHARDWDEAVLKVGQLERERDEALSKSVRSEQHPDCVVLLRTAWEALGEELLGVRAERDSLQSQVAALLSILDQTHSALFDRCGGSEPATPEERRILDLGIIPIGLFGNKSDTEAAALAHDRKIRAEAFEEAGLQSLVSFVVVMFGQGPDAIIPETVMTPLGVPVKLGDIMREVRALAEKERQ